MPQLKLGKNQSPRWDLLIVSFICASHYLAVLWDVVSVETNWPLLTIESPVAQWLEHPTRSRRVVGLNPIWDLDFFQF